MPNNIGAFGENFPYANQHDMNMDWIIKIAKDFLDQYTTIQQIITDGMDGLQEKYETLNNLLQAWYDEHSEDIANQLANAIQDLDDWYTTHQNYLDQTLQDNKNAFDEYAEAKAQNTIETIPADYSTLSANAIKSYRNVFNSSTITAPYDDMNTLPWNNVYVYLGSGASLVANAPTTRWFTVMTYCYDPTGNGISGIQIASGIGHESANKHWIRAKLGENSWGVWRELASVDMFTNYIKSNTTVFTDSNVTAPYNDLNTLPLNEIVVYLESATASLSNAPTTFWFTVMTFCYDPSGNGVSAVQIAFQIGGPEAVPKAGTMYTRTKTGVNTWTPWVIMEYNKNIYVSASGFYEGHPAFTTFRAGLEEAMKHEYSTLYINSGEYDLVNEYADLIESYQGGDNWCGPVVGKNITIIGNRNTKLKFRYTGNNDYIKRDFSPINISGNATIKNLMIDVENARYCVHEDMNTVYNFNPPVGHLRTEYINCEMLHRGSNGSYNAPFCIGRGDTGNSIMIVDGGYYHSPNDRHITIFSHNGGSEQSPIGNSYILIKNIIQGDSQDRFRFTAPNQNSVFISICNSLLGYPYIDYGENAQEKMRVTQWNNTYQN